MSQPSVLTPGRSDSAPSPRQAAAPSARPGPDRHSTVLRLRQLVAALANCRGSTVLIEGEPGVGKSTLLSVALDEASAAGCLILRGTPDDVDQLLLLRLEALSAGGVGDEQGAVVLDLGVFAPGAATDAVERVLTAVEQLCEKSPVVLAVDDLHRADRGALLLWHRLSRRTARLPLLLVATARPAPSTPSTGAFIRLRRALSAEGAELLQLGPLTSAEVADLVTNLLGAPAGVQLRRRLDSAGGNPAYVHELIKSLRQSNAIRVEGRIAEATGPGASGAMSADLVEAVCARLAPMSPDALEVLRLASLLGEEFTGRELAALSELEPHQLLSVLDEVIPAGVLVDCGPRLRFRHALVSQALYHSMRTTRRSALHRTAAQALDEAGAPVERVAEQLLNAAALARGWPAEWLAAKADELTFRAPELAVELFRRAIDHAAPEEPCRLVFEEKLAAAMYLVGRSDCAPAALGLLEYRVDPVRRTTWAFMSGNALIRVAKFTQGLDAVDEGESVLESAADQLPAGFVALWSARFAGLRAHLLWMLNKPDEARVFADRAVVLGERLDDPLTMFYGTHVNALLCGAVGDTPGCLVWEERGLTALGERWRLADQRLLLMMNHSVTLRRLDRDAEAKALLDRAHEVAERCGVTWRLASIVFQSATFLYATGRWDEALAGIRSIIDHPDAAKDRAALAAIRVMILVYRGRLEEARGDMPFVREGVGLRAGRMRRFPIKGASLFAEADGRPADAVEALLPQLLEGGAWALEERHWGQPDLTRLALEIGDDETARAAVAAAEADAKSDPANVRRRMSAKWCRGLYDRDLRLLTEAADYYRTVGFVPPLARISEDSAAVAAALGDLETARRHLEAAAESYLALGASWGLARADERLRVLGVRRGRRTGRSRPDSGWEALTPAEAKVALLVTEGCSNPEIADQLFLSPRTVQTHVSHILAKLGVHSRSEIAREAVRRAS